MTGILLVLVNISKNVLFTCTVFKTLIIHTTIKYMNNLKITAHLLKNLEIGCGRRDSFLKCV